MSLQLEQLSKSIERLTQQKHTLDTQSLQIAAQVQDDELQHLEQQLQS
jgi:chromosome segregation protein